MSDAPRAPWYQRLPLPVFFVVVFVVWTGSQLLLRPHRDAFEVALDGVFGLIYAGAFTVILATRRRRIGGADELRRYGLAVRSGTLPADVDVSRWRTMTDHDEARFRRDLWLVPVLEVPLLAIGVGLVITSPDRAGLAWLLVAFFVVLGVAALLSGRFTLRRVRRLRAALDAR